MNIIFSTRSLAAGALALASWGMTGLAQADEVYWSVGVSSPGVRVGVANAAPVMVMPQPVYQQPRPVYREPPRPVYRELPQVIYVQPAPFYRAPPQYVQSAWQRPDRGWEWRRRHGHHRYDRFESERCEGERGRRDQHDQHDRNHRRD